MRITSRELLLDDGPGAPIGGPALTIPPPLLNGLAISSGTYLRLPFVDFHFVFLFFFVENFYFSWDPKFYAR